MPDVLQLRPDLPPGTQKVINKAMAKDPEERYQTAAELAAAVSALLTSKEVDRAAAAALKLDPEVDEPPSEPQVVIEPKGAAAFDDGVDVESAQITEPFPAAGAAGGGLPSWIWWVGALALLLIAVFSLRAVLGGDTDAEPAPTKESSMPVEEPAFLLRKMSNWVIFGNGRQTV